MIDAKERAKRMSEALTDVLESDFEHVAERLVTKDKMREIYPDVGKMKRFEIWSEGYNCTGCEGNPVQANLVGKITASTFKEACKKFFACTPRWEKDGYFDAQRLTFWGCKLFDNEQDARKNFG